VPQIDHDRLRRRALLLQWATIAWNGGEVVVTIALGLAARSLALVAFGLDAVFEIFASLVAVWHVGGADSPGSTGRTRRAHRLVAVAFALLATLLTVGAVRSLATAHRPDASPWGIAYLAMAATAMLGLAVAKRGVAGRLDSGPLRAEATLTMLDGALAASILAALAVNALWGWWWADPAATLLVAALAFDEARENWADTD